MNAGGQGNDALPALPSELNDKLFALLFGDPAPRERAFAELLAANPAHADALRAHWQHHLRLEREGAPGEIGDATAIPGYRLLEVLGEGGMGTVYLAEQKEPVRRRVALKLIKLGMDSKAVVARFALERQALAVMNHDAIARIYDCGVTERGQSYFVMELVEGEPLTGYCDKHKLSLKQRIDIFQQVCAGIQHAHQKGVLHRDLKPGNVLVARKGDKHVAKIIDFGIARATNHQLVDQTIFTERGIMVGTPEYMSPEQACGESMHIDTRTDVYSLGVMLYELLVGELPFPSAELRQAGLLEIQRKLREDEPPKPSTKLTTRRALASEWAQNRNITVEGLRRALRGDLDWVVLKAMAKEPERRYESATALAEDLGRYLEHEPLRAGPPSGWYRLRKLVRRHRGRVAAGGVVFLTAVVGAVVSLQFALGEQATVREFNLLSAVVMHESAIAAEKELYPPWPHKIEAMERWLKEDAGKLLAMKKDIEQTVRDLEARALPQTDADRDADRRAHPRFAEFELRTKRVASLRHAQAIRNGKAQLVEPDLTAEQQALDAAGLNLLAWPRVAPPAKEAYAQERTVYGEEVLGLALARAAVSKARAADNEYQLLDTFAYALFANGQDAEARVRSAEALGNAPDKDQEAYRRYQGDLDELIEKEAVMLATAEQRLEDVTMAVSRRRTFRFELESHRFLHGTLSELLPKLRSFEAKEKVELEKRLVWARQVEELSRAHPKARHSWAAVRAAIASNERYVGQEIELREQDITGLVPIGENPITKLWEFYELRSAWAGKGDPREIAIPEHRSDGSIEVNGEMGIVLVLLPGGSFTMGAQKEDEGADNFDRDADRDETPHKVTLSPFFLSRYEMTQGQWARLWSGDESVRWPSFFKVGGDFQGVPVTVGPSHPVENVNWDECDLLLRQCGLSLPTEAQWEFGCRAGRSTPWYTGELPTSLAAHANVWDRSGIKLFPSWSIGGGMVEAFEDGFAGPSPVGHYPGTNPFGLYDMHGNVWEWCQDLNVSYVQWRAFDDVRRASPSTGVRVYRGGSYKHPASVARSANRSGAPASTRNYDIGVRPARALRL